MSRAPVSFPPNEAIENSTPGGLQASVRGAAHAKRRLSADCGAPLTERILVSIQAAISCDCIGRKESGSSSLQNAPPQCEALPGSDKCADGLLKKTTR
jgi:hypothetical protein